MSWFKKLLPKISTTRSAKRVPEGIWHTCPACNAILYRAELERNLNVCPKCEHHLRIGARERINQLLDADGREEIGAHLKPVDRLKFKDSKKYKDRLEDAVNDSGEDEALIVMKGTMDRMSVVLAC